MDRRGFLRDAALGAAAIGLGAGEQAAAAERGVVVIVHLPGSGAATADARRKLLERMVAAGVEKLSGKRGADAWRTWFGPRDVVALKVNTLAARAATSPELADVVARGLIGAGVRPASCLVYDRFQRELTAAGYQMGAQRAGYRVVATDGEGYGYDAAATRSGGVSQRLSSIVSKHATAIVNLPVIKDHNVAGITGALKNHYGSIANPAQLHGNHGDPHIGDVNALAALRGKQRLVIGEALMVIYEGGPTYQPSRRHALDCLLLSTDPVAHDAVAWKLIEQVRAAKGLRPLARVGREPKYLASAAAAPRSLGVADLAKVKTVRVELT